jgi:serine/threonine protein kinase
MPLPLVQELSIPPEFSAQFIVNWRMKLGEGAFSRVFECVEIATGDTYAVKIVDFRRWMGVLRTFNMQKTLREASIMKTLSHDNIVRMKDMFHSPSALWLVQELAAGSELFQVIVREGRVAEVRAAAAAC